jgi:hypothetical protein
MVSSGVGDVILKPIFHTWKQTTYIFLIKMAQEKMKWNMSPETRTHHHLQTCQSHWTWVHVDLWIQMSVGESKDKELLMNRKQQNPEIEKFYVICLGFSTNKLLGKRDWGKPMVSERLKDLVIFQQMRKIKLQYLWVATMWYNDKEMQGIDVCGNEYSGYFWDCD